MTYLRKEEKEYLDIFNEKGSKIGKAKRSVVHKKGLWHKAVHIWFINDKNELLIQRRSSKIRHPNQWDISAAGHISFGDDSITTAPKETKEELGINIQKKDIKKLFTVRAHNEDKKMNYINNEINDVYLVKTDLPISSFKIDKNEVSEIKYIPVKELQRYIEENDLLFVPHPEEYKKLFEFFGKKENYN